MAESMFQIPSRIKVVSADSGVKPMLTRANTDAMADKPWPPNLSSTHHQRQHRRQLPTTEYRPPDATNGLPQASQNMHTAGCGHKLALMWHPRFPFRTPYRRRLISLFESRREIALPTPHSPPYGSRSPPILLFAAIETSEMCCRLNSFTTAEYMI